MKNTDTKYDIFISYRRAGGFQTAKHLYDLLSREKYKVSFDIDTLREGDFDIELFERIDACRDFILILDKSVFDRTLDASMSKEKDWVRQEIARALAKRKNIVTVMLPGFRFPSNLPEDICRLPYKNGPKYDQDYFDAFYDRLKEFLHSKPEEDKQESPSLLFPIKSGWKVFLALMGVISILLWVELSGSRRIVLHISEAESSINTSLPAFQNGRVKLYNKNGRELLTEPISSLPLKHRILETDERMVKIVVEGAHYQNYDTVVSFFWWKEKTFSIRLNRNSDYAVWSGRVEDERLHPLEGVSVTIGDSTVMTDADGKYRLSFPLEKQTVYKTIRIAKKGYHFGKTSEQVINSHIYCPEGDEWIMYKDQ